MLQVVFFKIKSKGSNQKFGEVDLRLFKTIQSKIKSKLFLEPWGYLLFHARETFIQL